MGRTPLHHMTDSFKSIRKTDRWLVLFLAVQPCLDVLAYWTRNDRVTPAGIIRLLLLVALPCFTLIRTREKKSFLLFLAVVGTFCVLHAANCMRLGYLNPVFDLRYLAGVIQMPVFAVCFLLAIRDEQTKEAAFLGFATAGLLTLVFLLLARITNTGNVTYGEGLGYSGWVIDVNRNANSTNLVIYGALGLFLAIRTHRLGPVALVSAVLTVVYLTNGTKGCYFSIFVIFLSYALWLLLFERGWSGRRGICLVLVALCIFSAAIYPWTPRCRVSESQRNAARGSQGEIEATLLEQGIDISEMSPEERFADPTVKAVFEHYYWKYLGVLPDLIDRFGMDRVLMRYHMSTDVGMLIDNRVMERQYAAMIFEDSDFLTRIVGFEVSEMGYDGLYDLENDWHAIYYYYGYLGFALYVGFVLFFLLRVLRKLLRDRRQAYSLENFGLILTLVLNLGLAHFSGETLRRPNVSVWLSLILALVWYASADSTPKKKDGR